MVTSAFDSVPSLRSRASQWKLSPLSVVTIYRRAWRGERQSALAREYGVDPSVISAIKTGKQSGYREVVDAARRIGWIGAPTVTPDPVIVDDPVQPSTLFQSYPEDNILHYVLEARK